MGRIRSLKPDIHRCLPLAKVPIQARWTFAGLWCYLDDYGYGVDDPRLIKADIYPLDDITAAVVEEHLAALADQPELLCRYQAGGQRWLHVPRFLDANQAKADCAPWGQRPQKLYGGAAPPCGKDHEGPGQGTLFQSPTSSQPVGNRLATGPQLVANNRAPSSSSSSSRGVVELHAQSAAAAFDDFWKVYPRREGKRKALEEYTRALARASAEVILAGAARYRDDPNRVAQYTKHPSTWLHQDCWGDDPLPPRGTVRRSGDDEFMDGLRRAAEIQQAERGGQ